MSVAAAAAALALAAAGALAEVDRAEGRRGLDLAGRVLAAAGAVLLLFALGRPAARPSAVLALAAAVVAPRSLACLLAASAATVAAFRPDSSAVAGPAASLLVVAAAAALAAAAVQEAAEKGLAHRLHAGWGAVVGGGALTALLMALDRGGVLQWRYGLGAGAGRVELPGAAFVLGLALLVSLAGTLAMAAHLLAAAGPTDRARLLGKRLLVLGAGLGGLGAGVVGGEGLARSGRALGAGATDLAGLVLAIGLLVLGLVRLLVSPPGSETGADAGPPSPVGRALRLAAAVAVLAAAVAGLEGWWANGSYATTAVGETASAALLGLAAIQSTRLALPRAALFLIALIALLARAV